MLSAPATRNRFTLLLVWFVAYATFTLFLPPLLDDADSVHAEVAREMLLRHDWITLYANGIRYLEKAPILYWSMALSFKLFGVSTAAARLPIALTVLALALLLEAFARQAFRSVHAGLYAGLIVLSSFGIFIFTRITIPDADVCLWLTLALYAFWTTEQPTPAAHTHLTTKPQNDVILSEVKEPAIAPLAHTVPLRPCLVFAAACAVNILTKGLIGIVFPIAIVLVHLLLTRGPAGAIKRLRHLHPLAGVLTFLALAAPWHVLIGLANPTQGHPAHITFTNHHWQVPLPTEGNVHGWFWFYFVNEHLLRYLNLRIPRDYDTVPLWLFLGLIFVWLMPWSAYLSHAIARAFPFRVLFLPMRIRASFLRDYPAGRPNTSLLLLLWAAVPLLFFSLSTRQEYYVLPALPALILLLAHWLSRDSRIAWRPHTSAGKAVRRANDRIASALLTLGSLAAAIILIFLLRIRTPTPDTDLATLLHQNPADYALSFGHFLDLNARALGLFRLPLALTALALFVGPLANWRLRRRNRPHAATLYLAAAAFLFLLAAHLGLQTFSPVLSSKKLADAIAPQLHPEDLIVLHGEYESGSTLGFYLRRADLHILEGRSSNLWYGSFFADAPKIFETRDSIVHRWAGPQRIFLWQDPSDPERRALQLPAPVYFLARSGGKEILSNRPNHP